MDGKLKKELDGYKEILDERDYFKRKYTEAILLRDKEFVTMMKERSELLKLTEELKSAIAYHYQLIDDYEKKIAELKKDK